MIVGAGHIDHGKTTLGARKGGFRLAVDRKR